MKQYTDKDQTAKLIGLGFPRPQSIEYIDTEFDSAFNEHAIYNMRYSIGELIEFLPTTIDWTPRIIRENVIEYSFVTEDSELYYCNQNNELIDNLFDMCIRLKEEGVI